MDSSDPRIVRFGVFEADLAARELRKRGVRVKLQEQPFRLLQTLLERPGEIVAREEIQQQLWPDDTFVDFDKSLNTAAQKVRQALGDSADSPRFVETVPKLGYRFLAPITSADTAGETAPEAPEAATRVGARHRRAAVIACVGVTGLVVGLWIASSPDAPDPIARRLGRAVRFGVPAPPGAPFQLLFRGGGSVISPDGAYIAFVTSSATGGSQLWVHDLSAGTAQVIVGADGAQFPFWSPDSRRVAFRADGALKHVDRDGGVATEVCSVDGLNGGAWIESAEAPDGLIVFASARRPIQSVPAGGGEPLQITVLQGDERHRHPSFLPDKRRFLYHSHASNGQRSVRVASLNTGTEEIELELEATGKVVISRSDDAEAYLVFPRGRVLYAQRFDSAHLRLLDSPQPIVSDVESYDQVSRVNFSLSDTGALAYRPGGGGGALPETNLAWFDRSGVELARDEEPAQFFSMNLSPDDTRVATVIGDVETRTLNIWIHDFSRGVRERFTTTPTLDKAALWSPDGTTIAFGRSSRNELNSTDLYLRTVGNSREEIAILSNGKHNFPTSWTPDSEVVVFGAPDPNASAGIWMVETGSTQAKPESVRQSPFQERQGQVSPSGDSLAYASDETGDFEVYLDRFPLGGERVLVSQGGGAFPMWRGDGRELFYLRPDNTLMALPIEPAGTPAGAPEVLFRTHLPALFSLSAYPYDVSSDGRRFLMKVEPRARPITVILNWRELPDDATERR